jgi:hypothetical protein
MNCVKTIAGVVLVALVLSGCATQGGMTVAPGTIASPIAKYRNMVAIRSVTGGQAMNLLTMPGVPNEPFKAALESSLAANGYLAGSGSPSFYVDAEIQNLDQPLMGLDLDVSTTVTYKVSGRGGTANYPIVTKGTATFSDSVVAADRLRIANERAMQENIKQFLQALR